MSQRAMADQAGLSLSTVRRPERSESEVAIHARLSVLKILETLDACIGLLTGMALSWWVVTLESVVEKLGCSSRL